MSRVLVAPPPSQLTETHEKPRWAPGSLFRDGNGNMYAYVKLSGTTNGAKSEVAYARNPTSGPVTEVVATYTDTDSLKVAAGFFLGTFTAGRYGFIRVKGIVVDAKANTGLQKGTAIMVDSSTNGKVTTLSGGVPIGVVVVAFTGSSSDYKGNVLVDCTFPAWDD